MKVISIVIIFAISISVAYGDDAVQLTFDPEWDFSASWSPDGARIAFTSERTGNRGIYTIPANGGTPTTLYTSTHLVNNAEWSPDSSTIVFVTTQYDELMKIPATGGTATRFTYNSYFDLSPTWSSDDTKIAFFGHYAKKGSGGKQSDNNIYWIPADDGYATPQTIVYGDDNTSPEWAPHNSNMITFSRNNIDIWTRVIDGLYLNVTNDPEVDYHSTWSPDGQFLAFGSERSGNMDIWIIPATGGTPIQVTDDPALDRNPTWSPNGDKLAFTSLRSGNYDIWVIDVSHINIESASLGEIKATFATDEMIEKQK